MPTMTLMNCTVEATDGSFKICDARFSLNGESPHGLASYGEITATDHGTRAALADRLTDCEYKELPQGGLIITGVSRSAVRQTGARPEECKLTLRVSPGVSGDCGDGGIRVAE